MTNPFNYQQDITIKQPKRGPGCCLIVFLMVTVFVFASCFVGSAQAQTETPTPEPTKDITTHVELMPTEMPGQYFQIEWSASVGDVAVSLVSSLILLVFAIYAAFKIITHYLR
jgi:hypothetical protein